jgi:hypothetical protein
MASVQNQRSHAVLFNCSNKHEFWIPVPGTTRVQSQPHRATDYHFSLAAENIYPNLVVCLRRSLRQSRSHLCDHFKFWLAVFSVFFLTKWTIVSPNCPPSALRRFTYHHSSPQLGSRYRRRISIFPVKPAVMNGVSTTTKIHISVIQTRHEIFILKNG